MRALVLCFGIVAAIAVSGVLCSCAHGGIDSTESASENEPIIFWQSSGTPRCPFESLGSAETRYTRQQKELLSLARMRGADAVIGVTVRGSGRDWIRGELIRFTEPDCRY